MINITQENKELDINSLLENAPKSIQNLYESIQSSGLPEWLQRAQTQFDKIKAKRPNEVPESIATIFENGLAKQEDRTEKLKSFNTQDERRKHGLETLNLDQQDIQKLRQVHTMGPLFDQKINVEKRKAIQNDQTFVEKTGITKTHIKILMNYGFLGELPSQRKTLQNFGQDINARAKTNKEILLEYLELYKENIQQKGAGLIAIISGLTVLLGLGENISNRALEGTEFENGTTIGISLALFLLSFYRSQIGGGLKRKQELKKALETSDEQIEKILKNKGNKNFMIIQTNFPYQTAASIAEKLNKQHIFYTRNTQSEEAIPKLQIHITEVELNNIKDEEELTKYIKEKIDKETKNNNEKEPNIHLHISTPNFEKFNLIRNLKQSENRLISKIRIYTKSKKQIKKSIEKIGREYQESRIAK